jgi:hypothetical protein
MSAAAGVIPDPGGGGELAGDDRPVAEPGRRVKKGERLSEEHRRKVSEGVKRAHAEKAARAKGERTADKPPKPKAARAAAPDTKAADLQAIRELLGGILTAPSMLGAIRGDAWLTGHFMQRGPELAEAIVAEAARNDAFRVYLVRIAKAAQGASLIGALALYILPPLMHFGVAPGAEILGVPVVAPPTQGRGPGMAPPVPGQTPQFVAPERGPAQVVPEAPGVPLTDDQVRGMGYEPDDLAAELAEHEDAGGMVPPLPMEPV